VLIDDPQQVRDLSYHAAHRFVVRSLNNLIQFVQAEAAHDLFLRFRESNRASIVLDFELASHRVCFLLLRYHTISRVVLRLDPGLVRLRARHQCRV